MINPIQNVNVIIAGGSVDGMAGAAACIRHSGNPNIQLIFTQAFQVNTIDVSEWPANRQVGLIGLGVNNEGQSPNPQMTIDFVNKIYQSGHTILFIADEHGKKAWQDVLTSCGHDESELIIGPKERKEYGSSCAILLEKLDASADVHVKELLRSGHQGDQMNFDTPFGKIFNQAVKSNITDPRRRPYIVQHMAQHETPDAQIQRWMNEYAEMEANISKILASGKDLGEGMSLYDCRIAPHDATALFREAYKKSPIVLLSGTNVFLQGKMQVGASMATNKKDLNVLEIIQRAGIVSGGMAAKANFAFQDQEAAIQAVHMFLKQ